MEDVDTLAGLEEPALCCCYDARVKGAKPRELCLVIGQLKAYIHAMGIPTGGGIPKCFEDVPQ